MLYRGLEDIVDIYYGRFQVLEIMKLSPFLTSIPSLIVGIIIWRKMKLSREFNRWFVIALLTAFFLQIVGYLIWYFPMHSFLNKKIRKNNTKVCSSRLSKCFTFLGAIALT